MQNRKVIISLILKSLLSILSIIALTSEWATFELNSLRLFGFWAIFASAIFYLTATTYVFSHRHTDLTGCAPRATALMVVNLLILLVGASIFHANQLDFPTAGGFSGILLCYIIPILALADWLAFTPKGFLRTADPWLFLAPSVIYASLIFITDEHFPASSIWRYPYQFLNYPSVGLETMAWLLVISATLILIGGYVLFAFDFVLSSKLAQHVVLPRIKTVVVVEPPRPEIQIDGASKSQRKPSPNKSRPQPSHPKKPQSRDVNAHVAAKKRAKLTNVGKLQPIDVSTNQPSSIAKSAKPAKSQPSKSQSPKSSSKPQPSKPQSSKLKQNSKATDLERNKQSEFQIPHPSSKAKSSHESVSKSAPKPSAKSSSKAPEQATDKTSDKNPNKTADKAQPKNTSKPSKTAPRDEFQVPNLKKTKDSTKKLADDAASSAKDAKSKIRHF